jgi:lysophospholipase L1-like esterase
MVRKILFQGDSITDAYRRPEEQNPAFQLGNGYAFLIASKLAQAWPGRGYEFTNRGVSGNRVSQLRERWQADALEIPSDMLSLLAGVNETIVAMTGRECLDVEEFYLVYRSLLADFRAVNPAIHFVLLEPFCLEAGIVTPDWRVHLQPRQEVVKVIAEEFGAIFVPLQEAFNRAAQFTPPAYWIWDGIHPSHAGFQLIADAWLRATNDLLDARLFG